MTTPAAELKTHAHQMLEELKEMGAFRRGTVNVFHRKCGKERCACNRPGHPGHGPQRTLTFKQDAKTSARNLPTAAAVELVEEQIGNHDRFVEWAKRWTLLNEKISDLRLEEVLASGEPEGSPQKKKQPRRSSRRSPGRSRGS